MLDLPIVDLNAPDAAHHVDDACRTVGFFAVVGHGVPQRVIQRMLAAADEFFALDPVAKMSVETPDPSINRGYAAKLSETLAYSLGVEGMPPDLFEAFNIGPDSWPAGDPGYEAERHRLFAPNLWPEGDPVPDLRPALVDYFDHVCALAHRVTGLFARALHLEPDFFEPRTTHSTDVMRINHYLRSEGEPDPVHGQQRMGAHTDYGIVTVLYADPVPGLQIVGPDGDWHDVMPPPGSLLLNLGDLLAQWTNDRWRSTLHRVVPPPRSTGGPARRRSVAFFHDGNHDALVECLPTCCSDGDPPRYPPVLAGEHLMAKLTAPRELVASRAVSTADGRTVL